MRCCGWRRAASAAPTTSSTTARCPCSFPSIPGHEPVGRIAEIGRRRRSGGACARATACASRRCWLRRVSGVRGGKPRLCSGRRGAHQLVRVSSASMIAPGLWGGYAEYLYLSPTSFVHKIDDRISPEIATLFNPIGAGFRWAVDMPQLQAGESIVVLGPGQRGLAQRDRREGGGRVADHRHRPDARRREAGALPRVRRRRARSTSRRTTSGARCARRPAGAAPTS